MDTNLSNRATFWLVKNKLKGFSVIAVMVLAGCDQNVDYIGLELGERPDASLKEVAKLNQLKMLWLDNNQITDEGLKEVAKLQQLTHLGLAGTYVTDAGIKDLAKLKNLS